MGYITKNIAQITEPARVSLSARPNFVQFASLPAGKQYIDLSLRVQATQATPAAQTVLRLTEAGGTIHELRGTTNLDNVGGAVFYIAGDPADTAENLRQTLVAIPWVEANFEIRVPAVKQGETIVNGNTLRITGKGAGEDFRLVLSGVEGQTAYVFDWHSATSNDGDTIKGNASTVDVELDVYENPAAFLEGPDEPTSDAQLGTLALTMQKSYAGSPAWFDLNGAFSKYGGYVLPRAGWFNTGTAKAFRFIAKVRALTTTNFYISNVLYVLNGYAEAALDAFVFRGEQARLLTNAPRTDYRRGQKAYLTVLAAEAARADYVLSIGYSVFTRSGVFLGTQIRQGLNARDLSVTTTAQLEIDAVLDQYPTAGEVHVFLSRNGSAVSNEQVYIVRPECLHDVADFTFLNSLGGWDVFNFDAPISNETRREAETYKRTTTPTSVGGPEQVYRVDIEDEYLIEGAPVNDEVAEWLKEFAASLVVLAPDGRQIIIDDLVLNRTASNKNMHVPTLRYKYNKTYNNE